MPCQVKYSNICRLYNNEISSNITTTNVTISSGMNVHSINPVTIQIKMKMSNNKAITFLIKEMGCLKLVHGYDSFTKFYDKYKDNI